MGWGLLEWEPQVQQARELVLRGIETHILSTRPVEAQARLNKCTANQGPELLQL